MLLHSGLIANVKLHFLLLFVSVRARFLENLITLLYKAREIRLCLIPVEAHIQLAESQCVLIPPLEEAVHTDQLEQSMVYLLF